MNACVTHTLLRSLMEQRFPTPGAHLVPGAWLYNNAVRKTPYPHYR